MPAKTLVGLAEELLELARLTELTQDTSSEQYYQKHRLAELCDELKREALGPSEYTAALAESCQESSALHFVTALGVADIIGEGVASLDDLVQKTKVSKLYLGITMSNVVANGYFTEVGGFGTHIYKNNAFSHVLRLTNDDTMVEAVEFICDEGAKATAHLLEAGRTNDADICPFNLAFSYKGSIFRWLAESEGNWRGERMGKAMKQLHRIVNKNMVHDFPWNNLASPLVDVGGGIGSLEMALIQAIPHSELNYIVFDIPETAQNAQKIWSEDPELSPSIQAQVSFVGGNFLANTLESSNMPKGHPSYLIRHALHNWNDDAAVSILRRIREAMLTSPTNSPASSRLYVCEMLLAKDNSSFMRSTSMQLLTLNNGRTRTEKEMTCLMRDAGFEIVAVHRMRAVDSIIEAKPIL